ncbi:MAG: hypothetical protein JNL01_14115 [Bdellovibrionales bacterium]|nr:hypothetical protein [Bdellovibrionales bacterium]
MPFRSDAQVEKFRQLLKDGKISQETFDEWMRATPKGRLPKRIHPKKQNFSQQKPQRNRNGKS